MRSSAAATGRCPGKVRDKIALFCNVPPRVINETAPSYKVPLMLEEAAGKSGVRGIGISGPQAPPGVSGAAVSEPNARRPVGDRLVGKYAALHDAYISVVEALTHGGSKTWGQVDVRWVDLRTSTTAMPRTAGWVRWDRARRFWEPGNRGDDSAVCWAHENQFYLASAWGCRWRGGVRCHVAEVRLMLIPVNWQPPPIRSLT